LSVEIFTLPVSRNLFLLGVPKIWAQCALNLYGAKKMNMISTGAFLNEMDASNKQTSQAEKFAAVWEKKNAKAARAGGVSLMALSLAACGGSSSTTTSTSTTTTTTAAQSHALTTGIDTVVGGAGADSITAGATSAATQTLNTLDSIDGGAGTDTLAATIAANVTPGTSNVEVFNVSAIAAATLDLAGSTGITTLTNTGSSNTLTVSNIGGDVALTLANTASGGTFNYQATAVAGTADAKTVAVSGVTGGTLNMGTGVETLTIDSAGSANSLAGLSTSATTLNITGDQNFTIAAAGELTTQTTIDASGLTGKLTLQTDTTKAVSITGGSGADSITADGGSAIKETIDAGAGNDTVTFDDNLANADVVDGGEGTDTLASTYALLQALTNATAATDNISNFEAVTFTTAFTTNTAFTVASVQKTGIHTVTLDDLGVGAGANTNTINFLAGDSTLNLAGVIAGSSFTLDAAGSATDDTLAINVTDNAADAINGVTITTTDFETVTIDTSGTGVAADQTLGAVTMSASTGGTTTLKVTGDNAVDGSGIITAQTIDFSGVTDTDGVTMGAAASGVTTITGSAGNDTLLGDASSTINGGAGNDAITGGTGNDTLNGEDGVDTITPGAGTDTVDGGAGNDIVVLADGDASANDVVSGGEGTDTLVLTEAVTADEVVGYTSFETVRYDEAATQDMAVFANTTFTKVVHSDASGDISLSNVGASTNTVSLLDDGNNLNVTIARLIDTSSNALTIAGNTAGDTQYATITANNEETITITSGDASTETFEAALAASDLKTLTLEGTAGITVTGAITGAVDLATVTATGVTGAVVVNASNSAVAVTMTAGNGGATFTGGGGADTLTGGNGADSLTGGAGADTISGGAGDDGTLAGGAGNDTIDGGAGDDTISGQAGADVITTGSGADTVVADNLVLTSSTVSVDKVSDFTTGAGGDQIDISVTAVEAIMGGSNNLASAGDSDVNIGAGTAANVTYVTGAFDADNVAGEIVALSGTFAATTDVETALETGGSHAMTLNGIVDQSDAFLVLYDDGTDTFLAVAELTHATSHTDGTTFTSGDLVVTNILEFDGMADVTAAGFATGDNVNFDFIA